jgi:outer membrane protein assembly factor BamA
MEQKSTILLPIPKSKFIFSVIFNFIEMKRLFFLLAMFWLKSSCAQEPFRLEVVCHDKPAAFFTKKFSFRTTFTDSVKQQKEVDYVYSTLRQNGYLTSSVDSVVRLGRTTFAYIYVGDKFENVTIYNGNVPEDFLADIGLRKLGEGKVIPADGTQLFKAKVIQSCENIGYPFAEVQLDSFSIRDGNISAKLYLQAHELFRYDTLKIQGKTKVKGIFLRNYLGIKSGKVYNESAVRRINQRLNEIQFAEVIKPHTVEFRGEKAKINVYLKDRKASQFDLLIGVLPGSSGQKVLITGDVKIHLVSPFGAGEDLYLQWQKLQPKTQTLNLKVIYPYLVGLPLGVNINFELYKKDTAYLQLDGDYGVQYQMVGNNYLKASYRQKVSIILDPDTNFVKINRSLPTNLDLSTNEFALELYLQRLNYKFNPVSGYVLQTSIAAGARTIKKNTTLLGLYDNVEGKSFGYLYDTLKLTTFQMHIALMIDKFWKINNRMTVRTMFEGKYFFANKVLQNEQYQIGGVTSLRGFDDRSIFTPYYAMADLEYRYLISKNSYFFAFFNAAMVKQLGHFVNKPFDFPFGFGAGTTFETKVGLFGITYALGRQLDNPISFKTGKIHLGYVNYF